MTLDSSAVTEVHRPEGNLEPGALLRDGVPVRIRAAKETDREAVEDFLRTVSKESLKLRFFSAIRTQSVVEEVLGQAVFPSRLSLLLLTDEPHPRIIGHGEYVRFPTDPTRAEVAFLIADGFRSRGGATLLLHALARIARREPISTFVACVLRENLAMQDVFTGSGYPYSVVIEEGEVLVELDIREQPRERVVPIYLRGKVPDRHGDPLST